MDLLETELPRERSCGAEARRLVEERYGDGLDSDTLFDLKLVVTELVDNAYMHGEGRIRLKLHEREQRVRIEVMDEGENAAIKIRQVGASGGRGLRLVEQLCARWGAFEGSTHVWADLALPQS